MSSQAAEGTAPTGGPTADEVRGQLTKITSSKVFGESARLKRFLAYLVDETLAGRGPLLKEYKVGVDVFDRPESFDPRTDSVVRAQGTKLRSKLAEYYSAEGASDPIAIELPRGSYTATFQRRIVQEQIVQEQPRSPKPRGPKLVVAAAILVGVIAAAGAAVLILRRPAHSSPGTSVAVLPFINMSGDTENEYFSDGLTEEIIDALAKVKGLRVVARTSAFQFKSRAQDIRQIGKTLNVGTVLEGSVRKTGNRLRITAQLNDVSNGYHLWSNTFNASDQDIFRVQSEIAGAICRALLSTQAPSTGLVRQGTSNLQAYNLYLQGLYSWNQWTREADLRALDYLHQAIDLEPNYAQAYALLAGVHNVLGGPLRLNRAENMAKALASAQKALEIDPDSGEGHLALGMYHAIYNWDWEQADRHLGRALELEPGSARIHDGTGWYRTTVGQFGEAEVHLKRAVELDPLSFSAMAELGLLFMCENRPEDALQQFQKENALNPTRSAQANTAIVLADLGGVQEARAIVDRLTQADPARQILLNAYIRARGGDRAGALKFMAEAKAHDSGSVTGPAAAAGVYMILGDADRTIEQLTLAYEQRDSYFVYSVCALPAFRPLYGDPRFIALMKKIGK